MSEHKFEDELNSHGVLVYTNVGTSMMPLIGNHRDILTISKRPEGRLKKYDVAFFHRGEKYILHRVIRVKKDGYNIVGDHQYCIERNVKEEQILGVLTKVVRDGKEIPLHGFRYWTYVRLWCWFYPVRALILRFLTYTGIIIRRIKGGKKSK